jgi:hypothetical protein
MGWTFYGFRIRGEFRAENNEEKAKESCFIYMKAG